MPAPREKTSRAFYRRFRRRAKRVALWFKGFAGFFKGIATFAGVLVAIGFCVLIGIQVFGRAIEIEPIPGPKLMVENGFTPEVSARRLRDALADAEAKARTTMRGPEVSLNNDLPDITVPAVGVSLDAVAAYVRSLFGIHQQTVSGEFVVADQKLQTVVLRLRLDRRVFFTSAPVPLITPDAAMTEGALAVFGQVRPYIEAAALYPEQKTRCLGMIMQIIDGDRPHNDENVIRAYNLRGLIAMDDQRYQDAESDFRKAVSYDGRFAIGLINVGNALRTEKNFPQPRPNIGKQ